MLQSLLTDHAPPLGPSQPNTAIRPQLAALTPETLFPNQKIQDDSAARCCLAALWLWHSFLDESHTISQQIHTTEGSFWHAIMHRREGDFGNSKYWMRRVGTHPVIDHLAAQFPPYRDPYHFIDLCEQAARRGDENNPELSEIQKTEWHLLFNHCSQQALSQ